MNNKRYFGTDGIRGIANRHPITPEFALSLGKSIGTYFRRGKSHPRIIIGKDTRLSGYMIESALMSGICSMGADVYLVGPLPTPAIAFLVRSMRAEAGIVISASHNPFTDNGIKVYGSDGRKLPDAVELKLEALIDMGTPEGPEGVGLGRARRLDDAEGRYIVHAKSTLEAGLSLEGLKIVVDCANGAGYEVAPVILSELGAEVIALWDAPNGTNINSGCGSTEPGSMVRKVLETGADLGIALDGDADRAILADETGSIVDGDDMLFLGASRLKERGELRNDTVVGTIMTNVGLEAALRKMGIALVRARVGDRYVLEEMTSTGSVLGAEPSGHVIYLKHSATGDGVVTALQVLQSMVDAGEPLSKLTGGWKRYPQVMQNLRVDNNKTNLEGEPWFEEMLEEARGKLGTDNILSLRYSGTEPLLRVTVSSESEESTTMICDHLCNRLIERFGWEKI
ncbi:MAG: phosphoglucosamine mutase [bacterium]|nr:phosphoglucosamine mutase [bacterium]MDT8396116.1 phosphoglucosamine mutase [bacterium]